MSWVWEANKRCNGRVVQPGLVRGGLVWIEDPAQNGWTADSDGWWIKSDLEEATADDGSLMPDETGSASEAARENATAGRA